MSSSPELQELGPEKVIKGHLNANLLELITLLPQPDTATATQLHLHNKTSAASDHRANASQPMLNPETRSAGKATLPVRNLDLQPTGMIFHYSWSLPLKG